MLRVFNVILFYALWFVCIATALNGKIVYALVFTVVSCSLHFLIIQDKLKEFLLLCFVVTIGFCLDTFFVSQSLIDYRSPNHFDERIAPLWVLCLYAFFATTFNHSMQWMQNRPFTSALFGGVGGPLTYWAGQRVGVVTIPASSTFVLIAIVWTFLVPTTFALNRFLCQKTRNCI